MTKIHVKVNDHGTPRELAIRAQRLENLRPAFKRSETWMERSIGLRFREAKWAPLSNTTLKWHPHRAGGKPLNDTGRLRMSVTSGANKDYRKNRLSIGTGVKYARIQDKGGKTKFGTIPARPFLYFSEIDEKNIGRIFEDYINEVID